LDKAEEGQLKLKDKQVLLALNLVSLFSCLINRNGTDIRQRRRTLNRASQSAFHERKRNHVEDLQQQPDKLHKKNQHLLETNNQTVDELSNMKTYAEELNFEITMLQMRLDLQQGRFDGLEGTGPWKVGKLEEASRLPTGATLDTSEETSILVWEGLRYALRTQISWSFQY